MNNANISPQHRTFFLLLLTLIYVFNFVDRQIIGILSPFIQADLNLSNEQLGLLKGFAFALFYTILGVPIAWLADRYSRVNIIAISLTLWSVFTALTGMASNFLQMLLARVGVGIGEAGGSPPSHSIISDLYPAEERARALSVYALGIPLGIMFAYFVAGSLVETQGWRMTFIILGIPGVLLAIVLRLVVKEPLRGNSDKHASSSTPVGMITAMKVLLRIPSWWAMCLGIAFASFLSYALSAWQMDYLKPAFPDYDFSLLVTILGLLNGIVYGLGTYLGGVISDRWAMNNIRAYAFVPAIVCFLALPIALFSFWTTIEIHLVCTGLYLLCVGMYLGPCFSVAQNLAPTNMRAMSTALFFLVLNLISLGGGPTTVGFLADWFLPEHGQIHAIRLSMSIVCFALVFACISFLVAAYYLPKDWAKAQSASGNEN